MWVYTNTYCIIIGTGISLTKSMAPTAALAKKVDGPRGENPCLLLKRVVSEGLIPIFLVTRDT